MLWWADRYPDAKVTVYEPVSAHLAQIAYHVATNKLGERVEVCEAAAGVAEERLRIVAAVHEPRS